VQILEMREVYLAELATRLFGWNRDGEAFAPFVATAFEDGSSRSRAHPGEEAVRAFSANVAWLIGSFHCASSVYVTFLFDKERLYHHSLRGMSIFPQDKGGRIKAWIFALAGITSKQKH
jgi:hypothetical protein